MIIKLAISAAPSYLTEMHKSAQISSTFVFIFPDKVTPKTESYCYNNILNRLGKINP